MSQAAAFRCAIYTRKSTEEGLEQSFNSLHAQREACEAFVKSQAQEGWIALRGQYDDGGHSGGSMDRPALRRLLDDTTARRIDAVVVYKVDRLTRSLTDFAKIVAIFDKAGVSFVSVTQAFNTTSSMGRLTLNVLLSFAQFEREITGERIRDKIAASKAKGMWMGGLPPLGYDVPTSQSSRALVVNEDEAQTVRLIFRRFIEVGGLSALQHALQVEGVRSKRRICANGKSQGGHAFSRGALLHLLKNRTYLGEIVHRGEAHAGRHRAILDPQIFDAAQAMVAYNAKVRRTRTPRARAALLWGLLFDADGQLMEPRLPQRLRGRTYRYYASGPIVGGHDEDAIRRIPADAAEGFVKQSLARLLHVAEAELDDPTVRSLVERVEIHPSIVQLSLRVRALNSVDRGVTLKDLRRALAPGEAIQLEAHDNRLVRITLPIRLKVRGGRNWIVRPDGLAGKPAADPDLVLIERVRAAHAILRACGAQPNASAEQLRHARAPPNSRHTKLARWAFLAPDIQRAILEGRCQGAPTWKPILDIPTSWAAQRILFGVPANLAILEANESASAR